MGFVALFGSRARRGKISYRIAKKMPKPDLGFIPFFSPPRAALFVAFLLSAECAAAISSKPAQDAFALIIEAHFSVKISKVAYIEAVTIYILSGLQSRVNLMYTLGV